MRTDRFTIKATEALSEAQAKAQRLGHPEILPEHLLAALVEQKDSVVLPLLERIGVASEDVKAATQKLLESQPPSPDELEPSVPPELSRLVSSMLAKRAEERPTAGSVAGNLHCIRSEWREELSNPLLSSGEEWTGSILPDSLGSTVDLHPDAAPGTSVFREVSEEDSLSRGDTGASYPDEKGS